MYIRNIPYITTSHIQDSKEGSMKFATKKKESHTHQQPKGTFLPDLIRFVLCTCSYEHTHLYPLHIFSHPENIDLRPYRNGQPYPHC